MSPCGDKLQHPASNAYIRGKLFPSPCGDKLEFTMLVTQALNELFPSPRGENPLSHGLRRASSPERGSLMSGNGSCKSSPFGRAGAQRLRGFYGDKLQLHYDSYLRYQKHVFAPLRGWYKLGERGEGAEGCFRPLTEYNFTIPHIEPKEKNHPQEKRGWSRNDKP